MVTIGIEQRVIRGDDAFWESMSPNGRYGVVFEDDGETGYFYGLDTSLQEQPIVVAAHIMYRSLAEGTTRKLMCLGLFWHFLDIIWIFIYTFVYLFGLL